MKMLLIPSAILISLSVGGCGQTFSSTPVNTVQVYDPADFVQEYTQRADAITLSAGNAQEVNSRIHSVDPWPRDVANTQIHGSGERMARAVERHRLNRVAPPPLPLQTTSSVLSAGGGGGGGGGSAAAQ
jgi:hypothetical protein